MRSLLTAGSRSISRLSGSILSSRSRLLPQLEADQVLEVLSENEEIEELEKQFQTTEQMVANVLAQSDTKPVAELGEDATCAEHLRAFLQSSRYEVSQKSL